MQPISGPGVWKPATRPTTQPEPARRRTGFGALFGKPLPATKPTTQATPTAPPRPPMRPPAPPRATPSTRPADPEGVVRLPGDMGFEFRFAKGDFEFGGKTWPDVGIRFKGNSSYSFSQDGMKRPFKIDFNRNFDGQKFHGLTMITLSNHVMDPAIIREALAYEVFRLAGVPSPRTAFARVYLTLEGSHQREYLGLYTLVEDVNKTFLKDHFGSAKGLLMKPDGIAGTPYLGEEWSAYRRRFDPKTQATPEQMKRVIEATKFITQADDAAFRAGIDSYVDLDQFARFLAANAATVNMDSFLTLGHNYFLYLDPKSNKFHFIPWDLNLAFGGFVMSGSGKQQMDMSIAKPYIGDVRLIKRLLEIPWFESMYRDHVMRLAGTACEAKTLLARADAMSAAIAQPLAQEQAAVEKREGRRFFRIEKMIRQPPDVRQFIIGRSKSLDAQLYRGSAGWEAHYTGVFGFGERE